MSDIIRFPKKARKKGSRKSSKRFPALYLACLIMLLGISYRLVELQVVEAGQLGEKARIQRSISLEVPANRGDILDRNGEILAMSIEKDTIFATPYFVEETATTAKELGKIFDEDWEPIYEKLTRGSGFEYLRRKADRSIAKKIREAALPGIDMYPESERYYPGPSLASHTIGFLGLENDALTGLELTFDKKLRGKPGSLEMERDTQQRPIPGTPLVSKPPIHGEDLVLTIDKEIQYKAQVELKKAIEAADAAGGWVIVMDSALGEILALASEPTFNLNKFSETDEALFRNRIVTDVYEPGSTMKIVTAAAALEERLYVPESVFALPGTMVVGGYMIGEAISRGTEIFTFSQIVEKSSNIGAITLAQALGKERLYSYARDFGFTAPVGIELPGEAQGYIPTPDQWSASTLATVSYGQGISATPLEMIRAVNVIPSGGVLVDPTLIRSGDDSSGTSEAINNQDGRRERVLSRKTAATMAEILQRAVENGTGKRARIPGFAVGGKTGTANKVKPGVGYEPGKYISSFVGFTPVEKPGITILVSIDEPQGVYYGGVVAGPVFASVGEYALQRLKITP